jgi:hypothetical protein
MGSRRQLPDQLQYAGRVYFLNNAVIDKGLFGHIQLQAAKPAAPFYMVQGFVDDYLLKPAVEISLLRVKGVDASEHFYKSVPENISSLMLIDGIAHGDSHGKAIKPPVQLFLRYSFAAPAITDNIDKILLQ